MSARAPRPVRQPIAAPWPALSDEPYPWQLPVDLPASRRARRRHDGPYRAAVVPAIADLAVDLPPALRAEAEAAATDLARFDATLGGELAPFTTLLLRSESAASSRIEHLTASARAIAEAELGVVDRRNAAEIVAGTRAMTAALALAERLGERSLLAMHAALLAEHDPDHAGRWRTQQVWIGGDHLGPHGATFVPPHHRRVPAAIADLVRFIARDDLPVLVHVAIAHAQFETIHPFTDGNGRTGRALVQAMLRGARLTRNVTVPLSAGLLTDTGGYFADLTAYRAGDPGRIVARFAAAAQRAVVLGQGLIEDLRAVRTRWQADVVARRDSAAWRLCDLLLRRPVVDARLVAAELGIPVGNVGRYVAPLLDAGVLTADPDVRRNQRWRAPAILAALDGFAARAGRRGRQK
jgi:Fic family protein